MCAQTIERISIEVLTAAVFLYLVLLIILH
jgi:hypothetical protein